MTNIMIDVNANDWRNYFRGITISSASGSIAANEGISNFKDFYISSKTTDLRTLSKGTIYVQKDEDGRSIRAKVVSWVETDPRDWGGVIFYFPRGWHVEGVVSSYPAGSVHNNLRPYIAK